MSPTTPAATRSTLTQSLALVWRTLRSMRTALILLLLLALAAVAGSLLPQIPNSPDRVVSYLAAHPFWGDLLLRAGFLDVFGSWWFTMITVLLFTSLVACLVPRSRAMVRAMRQRPVQARELDAFRHYASRRVAMQPGAAAEASRRVLRRRRFRLRADGSSLAAEKGALREAGSLVFHWAFVLLLVGVVVGKGTGYSGRATIVERTPAWVDAPANYDGTLRAGRFFRGDTSGIGIKLLSFQDQFRASGVPMDFVSRVALEDPSGDTVETADVRVNHPVSFEGVRIFQFGFGWAPKLTVMRSGTPIATDPVVTGQETAPDGVSQLAMPWNGFIKLPSGRPQMAIQFQLWPDGRGFFVRDAPMVSEFNPIIRYTLWRGPLLDPSNAGLDTSAMHRAGRGIIAGRWTMDLDRGCVISGPSTGQLGKLANTCRPGSATPKLTLSFDDLRRYSVLTITRDAGVPVVFLAAILVLGGLLAAMYSSRRKLWVRFEPDGDGSIMRVGGFALQRKAQFEDEFAGIVGALVAATGGEAPARQMVGTP
jgi:cytochrome c biogenesis protein